MIRNIVLLTLFTVFYAGFFLFFTSSPEKTTDRNGFGEFTETGYICDTCAFEMEFEPDWIPLDGAAIAKSYTASELRDYFGEEGSYDLITGFSSPELYMECVRYNNVNMNSSSFTKTYLERELDYCKQNVSLIGGTLTGCGSYVIQAQGNGQNMGVYYCDYILDDQFMSELNCYVNCGKDTLWIYGYYLNKDGLNTMLDFLRTGFTFNYNVATSL